MRPGAGDGAADADRLAARLWSLGAAGVEERPDRLVGAFVDRETACAAAAALGGGEPREVADDVGIDAWRVHATAVTAGPFVIHPPWVEAPTTGQSISIDPGHAFGSGSHVSTRLALRALSTAVEPGHRVLDLGCGSGVLAIGAALLDADVVATDVDTEARVVTEHNALANAVAHRVTVCRPDEVGGRFDTVVINMTIDQHEAVAPDASRWMTPRTAVIASGVLAGPQVARVATTHRRAVAAELVEGEWSCVTLR